MCPGIPGHTGLNFSSVMIYLTFYAQLLVWYNNLIFLILIIISWLFIISIISFVSIIGKWNKQWIAVIYIECREILWYGNIALWSRDLWHQIRMLWQCWSGDDIGYTCEVQSLGYFVFLFRIQRNWPLYQHVICTQREM